MRPAATAAPSGAKGERPWAMRSALTNSVTPRVSLREGGAGGGFAGAVGAGEGDQARVARRWRSRHLLSDVDLAGDGGGDEGGAVFFEAVDGLSRTRSMLVRSNLRESWPR